MFFRITSDSISKMGLRFAPHKLGRIIEAKVREVDQDNTKALYTRPFTWQIEATVPQAEVVNLMLDIERAIAVFKEAS